MITANAAAATASSSSFLVMGDWGGKPSWPYSTTEEVATAKGMNAVAASENLDFALALGDNFYDSGVKSVDDKRFSETFEKVFSGDALKDPFVFNVIAGNHDHNGNVSAQVAYSSVSARWSFPSLYYDFEKNIGGSTVHFVMIDTVILSGNSDVTSQETGEIVASLTGAELAERWSPSAVEQRVADDQWTWIESTLKDSKADFIIVAGHYPVYSICEHGPTPLLETKLVPLLETYRVTAFLNGHDHCAQHIDPGTGVDYHTIGSAHYNDKSTAHADAIPKDSLKFHATGAVGGFGKISVDNGSLVVEHLDGDGKTLYTAPARPSRSN